MKEVTTTIIVKDLDTLKLAIVSRGGIKKASKEIGISESNLHSILDNKSKVLKKILKICNFLDISITDIKEWSE